MPTKLPIQLFASNPRLSYYVVAYQITGRTAYRVSLCKEEFAFPDGDELAVDVLDNNDGTFDISDRGRVFLRSFDESFAVNKIESGRIFDLWGDALKHQKKNLASDNRHVLFKNKVAGADIATATENFLNAAWNIYNGILKKYEEEKTPRSNICR